MKGYLRMRNNTKQIKHKIPIIVFILLIILTIVILIKQQSVSKTQIEDYVAKEYSVNIGINNTPIDIEKIIAKNNNEVNAPTVSAGMIPVVEISNGIWLIVEKDTWQNNYNYFQNKPAYMMLSDGKYISEPLQDMTGKAIATARYTSTRE